MSFYAMTAKQVVLLIIISAVISAALVIINISLKDYLLTPEVIYSNDNKCVKVINYQNGHAFNCNDVDVILRQYRKVIEK